MAELLNPGILLDIVDDEWLMEKLPNDGMSPHLTRVGLHDLKE